MKYRLSFKVIAVIVFAAGAYLNLHDYFSSVALGDKKIRLTIGIGAGLMAIFQFVDVITLLRKKKTA